MKIKLPSLQRAIDISVYVFMCGMGLAILAMAAIGMWMMFQ